MASNVVFNGVTYSIPAEADEAWGPDVSAYLISLASNTFQKSGGSFALTGEVNFGSGFGIKLPYIKSAATNPAGAGMLRLGNAEVISWRNAANSANKDLTVNASDKLTFNAVELVDLSSIQTLTNKIISFADNDIQGLTADLIPYDDSLSPSFGATDTQEALDAAKTLISTLDTDVTNAANAANAAQVAATAAQADIDGHEANVSNPHLVTKAQVGLGNCDNTADSAKPVSTAQAAADTAVQAFAIQRANHTGTQAMTTLTGTATIAQGGTNNGSLAVTAGGVLYTDGTKVVNVGAGTSNQILKSNGSSAPSWQSYTPPLITNYLASGSGTHTLTGSPVRVEMIVAGGGGGGAGAGTGRASGANGGTSTVGTSGSIVSCTGGAGAALDSNGGAGGTVTLGTGVTGLPITGGQGAASGQVGQAPGGNGGVNPLAGAGGGGAGGAANGSSGAANTGAGGGGAGSVTGATGAGGGAGGYAHAQISGSTLTALSGSIPFTVGSGGAKGGGTFTGGDGALGRVTFIEHYS